MIGSVMTNYPGSLDYWFSRYDWLNFLSVNDYPVLMVFWNLFLLSFPFLAVYLLKKYFSNVKPLNLNAKVARVFLFLFWLLFFPNSAYIITDVRHISGYCPGADLTRVCSAEAWMIVFFFVYAFLGWVAFVLLLNQMKAWIQDSKGRLWAEIFPLVVIPLTSLGVLLGLLNRFNSWEFFFRPGEIVKSSLAYFSQPELFFDWLVFTLAFYFLYYLGNYILKKF